MTDGDQMEVAIFCLEQMGQATTIGKHEVVDDWEMAEQYVLKLDHVSKACRILERRGWPEPFPQSARNAAEAFVSAWQNGKGKDLRDAYTHYEGALSDPKHRLRGEPVDYQTVRGVMDKPIWMTVISRSVEQGPDFIKLLGKEYDLRGVHEALMNLRQEFEKVIRP